MLGVVNRDRAVAIVASTGMILTWLANAASPRPEPAAPAAAPQAAAAVAGVAESVRPGLRHGARDRAVAPPHRRRTRPETVRARPVQVRGAPGRPDAAPRHRRRPPSVDAPAVTRLPADEPLPFRLIGVAERATGDTTVRTAVVVGQGRRLHRRRRRPGDRAVHGGGGRRRGHRVDRRDDGPGRAPGTEVMTRSSRRRRAPARWPHVPTLARPVGRLSIMCAAVGGARTNVGANRCGARSDRALIACLGRSFPQGFPQKL